MKKQFNKGLLPVILLSTMGLTGCNNMLYSQNQAPIYSDTLSKRRGAPAIINSTLTPVRSTATMTPAPVRSTATMRPSPITRSSSTSVKNSTNPYASTSRKLASPQNYNNAVVKHSSPPLLNGKAQPTIANTVSSAAQPITTSVNNGINQGAEVVSSANSHIKEATTVLKQQPQNTVSVAAASRPAAAIKKAATDTDNAAKTVNATTTDAVEKAVSSATETATSAIDKTKAVAKAKNPSATTALLQEARTAVSGGNYNKAASALERAHRIEPGNSKILYDIAQIRYAQGKYSQAESFASKAATLSRTPSLSKKTWLLLSNSRKALGNNIGAETAAKKAASF